MKIILALLLAVGVNHNSSHIDNGYNMITQATGIQVSCLKCGHKWNTSVNSVLQGKGCPHCNLSHGALEIKRILDNLSIHYETEYRFNDCKDNRSLPFDFYIPSKNMCIEYDGEQHFMPIRFSKNATQEQINNDFESRKRRDKIKDNYCKN